MKKEWERYSFFFYSLSMYYTLIDIFERDESSPHSKRVLNSNPVSGYLREDQFFSHRPKTTTCIRLTGDTVGTSAPRCTSSHWMYLFSLKNIKHERSRIFLKHTTVHWMKMFIIYLINVMIWDGTGEDVNLDCKSPYLSPTSQSGKTRN